MCLLNTREDQLLVLPGWKDTVWSPSHRVVGWSAWGLVLYWGLIVGLCCSWVGCSEASVSWLGKWESMPPSLLLSSFLPEWLLYSCPHATSSGMANVNCLSHFPYLVVHSALDVFWWAWTHEKDFRTLCPLLYVHMFVSTHTFLHPLYSLFP